MSSETTNRDQANRENGSLMDAFKKIDIKTITMVIILAILWVGFHILTGGSFITNRNLSNLTRQMAVVGIMGITMVLVIVSGGIDLSAGSVMGFVGCCAAVLQVKAGMSTGVVIALCLALGAIIGLLEGSLVAYAGMAPFIVTLGGQLAFKGGILAVTGGKTIAPMKESFLFWGGSYCPPLVGWIVVIAAVAVKLFLAIRRRGQQEKYGTDKEPMSHVILKWIGFSVVLAVATMVLNSYRGIPVPVMLMLALTVIFTFIADRTTFGRSIYAIGGNVAAARFAGINVKKNLTIVYMLNGFMCAIAGMVFTARLNAGTSQAGLNYELDAIAASVIGGTSMTGGVGRVAGALLGAIIMASIDNGMSMMNLDSFWQYIVKGVILVLAVWFDTQTQKRGNK